MRTPADAPKATRLRHIVALLRTAWNWLWSTVPTLAHRFGGLLRTTPARITIFGASLVVLLVIRFFLATRFFGRMSPASTHTLDVAKWIGAWAAAILAVLSLLENWRGVRGRRRAAALAMLSTVTWTAYYTLEPPPKVSVTTKRDVQILERFNAEYWGKRRSPSAERVAKAVLSSDEIDPYALAQAQLAQNRPDGAIALLEKSLLDRRAIENDIANLHYYKAEALFRLDNERHYREAVSELDRALVLASQDVRQRSLALKCRCLRKLDDLSAASDTCDEALRENPNEPFARAEKGAVLLGMATIRRLQGDAGAAEAKRLYEAGLAALNVSLGYLPENVHAWNNKAIALMQLGRPGEALAAARQALSLEPHFPDALLQEGTALKRLHRLKEAIPIYQELTRVSARDREAWSNLGDAIEHTGGRLEDALAAYDAALQIDPTFEDALFNRGEVLVRLGRYAEALGALQSALVENPDDSEALVNEAVAFGSLGRRTEGLEAIGKALKLTPTDEETLKVRDWLLAIKPPS